MKVWTVTSTDDHPKLGTNRCVIGSFTTRGRALDECVDYILQRLRIRDDLAFCMANDENHPEAKEFFSGRNERSDNWHVKRGKVKDLMAFLRDMIGGDGCYYAFLDAGMGNISYHFDIDENDVEGEMFVTVTWGSSDCEDPEFTTPKPELFVTEDAAILTFVNYVKGLMADNGVEIPDDMYAVVETQLHESGKSQVDLTDGCSVSCVIYSEDAKSVKE